MRSDDPVGGEAVPRLEPANGGALREIGGDAAVCVEPRDDRALAAAIRTLVTDQAARRERVELGLLRAAEFSWKRTAREMAAVYAAVRATLVDREPADPRDRAAVSEG